MTKQELVDSLVGADPSSVVWITDENGTVQDISGVEFDDEGVMLYTTEVD